MLDVNLRTYLLAAATSAALVGCERGNDSPVAESTNDAPSATTNKSIGESVVENKDQFIAAMDKKLNEFDAKINELTAKSSHFTGSAKADADNALSKLRDQRETARQKIDDLKKATKEAWGETKVGFQNAWQDLEDAYGKAKAKFTNDDGSQGQ